MAIHDQNYVQYDGPIDESRAWWTIAWATFRSYLKFLRTKLTIAFLWLAPLATVVLIFAEYGLRGTMGQMTGEVTAPSGSYIAGYLQLATFSLAILYMAAGAGVISDDLRYRTFQLYFSKPISRLDYALGKFLGVFMLGSLVSVIPLVVLGGLRVALYTQSDFFKPVLLDTSIGIGLGVFITIILCAILTGLSSSTSRTGYVVLSWIGVLLVPLILHGIVAIATDGADHARLWSLTGNFSIVADVLLTEEATFEGMMWLAPVILVAAGTAGLTALTLRITRLEGVA